ncbi:MAG: carbohydrate kinase family protein [Clostridia bacterium]|nr:carbohydrate kinase family protein [Clostridia bacterium]
MNKKIFITHGDIILDKIYNDKLELINQDGGGCNWNDIYNLSLMGEKCYAFGSCGNDEEGKIALESLTKAGVNTNNIIIEEKPTNIMNIVIPNKNLEDDSIMHSWYNPITLDYTMNFSKNLPTSIPKKLEKYESYIILDKFLPINLEFVNNIKNKKVCLDIGHIRFFEHFTRQYLLNFFKLANYIQLNDNVVPLLFERLRVKSLVELYKLLNPELMVLTKGKRGAEYVYREDGEIKIDFESPSVIIDIVDSSGAGDAFFSTTLREFAYTDKIDTRFIKNTFELANKSSREIIMQIGSRISKPT